MPAITISGPPGAGTTTVAKLLKERTGLPYVYAGEIFRNKAHEMGMSLADFGIYVEKHHEIDVELDKEMMDVLRKGDVILEGRVSGWMAAKEKILAFKVYIDADEKVRAKRVAERESKDINAVLKENRAREKSERKRYLAEYDFDILDTKCYDLVIDSGDKTPDHITELIVIGGGMFH
jgi:CMP/dCMP kinase